MAAERSKEKEDDYLDYLTATQIEQEELLNIVYESELSHLNDANHTGPLLTESEIFALFDCGYDVDMIAKTYPELGLDKIKQIKRKWSDKHHKSKKKKHDEAWSISESASASNEDLEMKSAHKQTERSFRTPPFKHRKKRKSKRKRKSLDKSGKK